MQAKIGFPQYRDLVLNPETTPQTAQQGIQLAGPVAGKDNNMNTRFSGPIGTVNHPGRVPEKGFFLPPGLQIPCNDL